MFLPRGGAPHPFLQVQDACRALVDPVKVDLRRLEDALARALRRNRMRIALMVILYKAKVVGTGLILKALLNLTAPAWFSIFAKPVSTQLHSSA